MVVAVLSVLVFPPDLSPAVFAVEEDVTVLLPFSSMLVFVSVGLLFPALFAVGVVDDDAVD